MELLVKKTGPNEQGSISTSALLLPYDKKFKEIEKTLKLVVEYFEEDKVPLMRKDIEEVLFDKNVFVVGAPINISSHPDIEKSDNIGLGTMYYDYINDRIRVKTKQKWTTINGNI